ncbi:dynamin family protein [Nonomuraea sp. NPDC049152]|uniref:dynamin family protein n=1 Tax=Nonomuraea sp. NPDC049152 TaxID=3154350 RepID=UPI0033DE8BF9
MRSAGDAPESLGEQTLSFRAIRDDDGPERAAEDQERVRQANGAAPPPPDAHTASMADDQEDGAEDTFFAFARPAAHDLPRPDDYSTLDPEPAFDTLTPASDDFDAFAPAAPTAPTTFDAFRAATPARQTPPAAHPDPLPTNPRTERHAEAAASADGPEFTDVSPEEPAPATAEDLAQTGVPDADGSGGDDASSPATEAPEDELPAAPQTGIFEGDVPETGDAEANEDQIADVQTVDDQRSIVRSSEVQTGDVQAADVQTADVQTGHGQIDGAENEAAGSEADEDPVAGSEVDEAAEGGTTEPHVEADSAGVIADRQGDAEVAAVEIEAAVTEAAEAAEDEIREPRDETDPAEITADPQDDAAIEAVSTVDAEPDDEAAPIEAAPVDLTGSDLTGSERAESDSTGTGDTGPGDAGPSDTTTWDTGTWDTGPGDDLVSAEEAGAAHDDDAIGPAGSGDEAADARSAVQDQAGRVLEEDLPDAAAQALTAALDALKEAVADLRFGLELPGAEEAREAQAEILTQLQDYVLPRVRMSAAPALIVVAGSTGAGKSTLVNTLAEKNVSRTGVRRPTTGIPVLACHPDDEAWFAGGELLAGLERIDRQSREAAPDSLVLVTTERLPQGVALLDTPDIDSVVEEHHEIARRMLDAADLWVFVTTAARYADAPAWNLLRLAKERAARIAIVLSRVQPKTKDVVLKHFVRMLTEYGLGDVERFVIDESAVADGKLPHGDMTELRMWLAELSVDEERRAQAVQDTLNGVLNSFRTRVPALARHLEGQVAFRAELRTDVDVAYSGALAHIETAIREGNLLRGEVRARWQDFAGSGDLTRSFRKKGKPVPPERITAFRAALRTALESLITSAAHHASDEVGARWRRRSELGAGLDRPSDDLVRRTGRAVAAWQEHVTELLRTDGVTKRSAKVVSLDAESLSLIFMVGLFSADALPQKLLKSLLGAEALRSISAKALSDLRARIVMLFDEEAMRYVRALDAAGIPDEAAATRLYQATYNLEVAR